MKERKDIDLDRRRGSEDLGGVVGGENKIRIYCMKKILFDKIKDCKKKAILAYPLSILVFSQTFYLVTHTFDEL